ncbi:MAG: hypothetical protein FWF88_11125 [Peptococcaceae bacterium]|nr:hypothetical protein [Peptococcaceae bacterium]
MDNDNGQWTMGNGEWAMRQWTMGNGQWAVGNEALDNGQRGETWSI